MPEVVEKDIVKHFLNLQNEFDKYFPETSDEELDFVRNLFTFPVEKLPDECQDKFLELMNNSGARQEYQEKPLSHFWVRLKDSYPQATETPLHILIFFVSTYLCKSGFSSLIQIKAKHRNRLAVEDDLRCALSQTTPHIQLLSENKQEEISH